VSGWGWWNKVAPRLSNVKGAPYRVRAGAYELLR